MIETNSSYMFNSSKPLSMNNNSISTHTNSYYNQQPYKSYSPTTEPPQHQTVDSWLDSKPEIEDNRKGKRRKEMNVLMKELNQDYLNKRERLYLEKSSLVDQEIKEAKQDKHALYLERLKDLEQMREKMIQDGAIFREYQNQVTENQFRLEIYQAEEEYCAEIQEIREKLFSIIEEKRRKLKEEKDNHEMGYDVVFESSSRLNKRTLRKRNNDQLETKSNKKKQTTGPVFNIKLKDEEIVSDLEAMKSSIK